MNNLTEPAANIAVKTKSFKLRRKTDYGEAMNIRISEILEDFQKPSPKPFFMTS